MIRFNWGKLRKQFDTLMPHDRAMNRRRPWWLRTGQVYYVAGNLTTRWVLVGFSSHAGICSALITSASLGRGTEKVHRDAVLLQPFK